MPVVASGNGAKPDAVVFGVVRFEAGGDRQITDAVITFDSPGSADVFAIEQGWQDYQVTPLQFVATDLRPPTGGRMRSNIPHPRLGGSGGR